MSSRRCLVISLAVARGCLRDTLLTNPLQLGRVPDTPIFLLDSLHPGDEVAGPAIVIDDTQTIVVLNTKTLDVKAVSFRMAGWSL